MRQPGGNTTKITGTISLNLTAEWLHGSFQARNPTVLIYHNYLLKLLPCLNNSLN
jgi:hypothetical protein